MEESWENWPLHMEMARDDDFFEKCRSADDDDDDDDFLRDILQQPAFSSESENQSFHASSTVQNSSALVAGAWTVADGGSASSEEISGSLGKSNSSSSMVSQPHDDDDASKRVRPITTSSCPRTYILSFDSSTVIPATPDPYLKYDQIGSGHEETSLRCGRSLLPSKRGLPVPLPLPLPASNENSEQAPKARGSSNQGQGGAKKGRSTSQSMDHIMAERKRRQELTERFIALSATIPGLKKTDKASILRAAIDYVKQLQERVKELENQESNKRGTVTFVKKSNVCGNEDTISSETNSDDECVTTMISEALPEIEARVLEEEVLIEIHCKRKNGIELKVLNQLENLHLSVTGSSVLPFGNSALGITVVAQMGEAYKMTVDDLVANLRQVLLKSHGLKQ